MSASSELDRIWSHTTQNGTDIVALQLDVARIRKLLLDARIERPTATRQIGDYLPDPVRQQAPAPDYRTERADDCGCPASDDLRQQLTTIRALLAEAPPLSEPPTAEQLILVGIREALE